MAGRKVRVGGQYRPLKDDDVRAVHDTCMSVFEEVGFQLHVPEALDLFAEAGATVDKDSATVKMSRDLVMEILKRAPDTVMLYGRDPDGAHDLTIGGTNVYMGTGGTALKVLDPGATENRPSLISDVSDMARTVDKLDNIDFYMLNVYPNDLEVDEVDVNRFTAGLNRTAKHIMGGVYTTEGVRNVVRIGHMIAGSPEAFQEKPFLSMVACVISPMVIDEKYGTLAMEAVHQGVPVVVPAEPLCGATAPMTLAGNVVVWAVDTLAGVMLTQLVKPGAPVLAGCVASVTDMRDLKYLSGAVEMGLINAAAAQMAQFYRIPVYTTAGMSDAKVNDAQAGYESAITSTLVALAGGNFIHDAAGFLEFCMTASYDKLVLDNEILGMVMRAVQGIEVNQDTLALDQIRRVGAGGHFVSNRHTRKYMRTELFSPQLSDREDRITWAEAGSKDTWARAAEKARAILDAPIEPVLTEDVRKRIYEEIPGVKPFLLDVEQGS